MRHILFYNWKKYQSISVIFKEIRAKILNMLQSVTVVVMDPVYDNS